MADASLSQSEIDALLQGAEGLDLGSPAPAAPKADGKKGGLSAKDLAAAQKVAETIAAAQAAALFSTVGQQATFEVSSAKVSGLKETTGQFDGEVLVVKLAYSQPASGTVFYLLKEEDARALAGLTQGTPAETLDDNALNTLQEVLSQMSAGADTEVTSNHGISFESSPPKAAVAQASKLNIPDGDYWTVEMTMQIEGTLDTTFYQLYPVSLAKALAGGKGGAREEKASSAGNLDSLLDGGAGGAPSMSVQNAEFSNLVTTADPALTGNISLLLDVPMEVTVELGRSTKTVQEVLSLGEGSIIELDKLAGEPVDLLVNGKPIAKGEVVVIDENFGVRVTEIVNLKGRLANDE